MEENKLPDNLRNKYLYYPSLDGLRFFAFLVVFLHHSLLNVSSDNPFINYLLVIIEKNGWIGVDLFFVLSGFLITTLLLREREQFTKFSLKNFWIRRSLRIWPLYYLALLVGFFITPYFLPNDLSDLNSLKRELPYYFFFLGNWTVSTNGYSHFSNISHLWTISLEEQFYLVWPIILIFIKGIRSTVLVSLSIILISLFTRFWMAQAQIQHPGIYTNTLARIDTLTFGALLALILFYRPKVLSLFKNIFRLPIQIIIFSIFLSYLHKIYLFDPKQTFNIVFGYLIITVVMGYFVISAIQEGSFFANFLKIKPFVYLGKISYGLYIWHILAIDLVFNYLNPDLKLISVVLSFGLTCLIATLSYYLFESKFLKLKSRFTKIPSRGI